MGLMALARATVLGLQVTDVNVFGGVLIGCFCGWLYNKLMRRKGIGVYPVYGGPATALLAMVPLSIIFGIGRLSCGPIANAISNASSFIAASGGLGVFIYGFLNRVLVPLGMHHFMWMPFDFTPRLAARRSSPARVFPAQQTSSYAELPPYRRRILTTVDPSVRFAMFGFGRNS